MLFKAGTELPYNFPFNFHPCFHAWYFSKRKTFITFALDKQFIAIYFYFILVPTFETTRISLQTCQTVLRICMISIIVKYIISKARRINFQKEEKY